MNHLAQDYVVVKRSPEDPRIIVAGEGLQYASPMVDGDDLLLLVRTSEGGPNQHDADIMTFHRVRDFRAHALDLRGKSD